ncbi:MAG TPA: FecR domain-containing protein, partial [Terriglobia bacterium]|nr:FecR domain-containing protein [Terriglobia bacterium]
MKRRKDNVDEFLLRHLGLFKTPPKQEMDAAEARIEKGLRTAPAAAEFRTVDLASARRGGKVLRLAFALATVAAAIALVLVWKVPREVDAHVVLASPDGSLSRVSGDRTESVRSGERIEPGATLRTNDATAAINLADGSRVELRPQAEFSVERATDGVRIVLYRGGLVVHAAKQLTGYLHVQTKDVIVSV